MDKLRRLKKQLIRQSIISLAILSCIGGAYYGINHYNSSLEQKHTEAERKLRKARTDIAQLEQKFNIYESSFSAFRNIKEQYDQNIFTVNLDDAQSSLNALRQKHRITNLNVDITPRELFNPAKAKYVGFNAIFREVTLTFSALSDAHIYAFTDAIADKFSGFIRFTHADIRRARPVSPTIIKEIQRGSAPSMAEATIRFLWIGIDEKQEEKK